MKKTTLRLFGAAAFFIIASFNSLKASATVIPSQEDDGRPPLIIRNATDFPLIVTFSPRTSPQEAPPYTWHIAPKTAEKPYNEERLTSYNHGPLKTDLTEADRYGTLTISKSSEVEKDTIIFSDLVDTSAFFSFYPEYNLFYTLEDDTTAFFSFYPEYNLFYTLEDDTTPAGKTAPMWLVEQLQEALTGTSPLKCEMRKLREKWVTMTSDEKENPLRAGFPSCLHSVDFTPPLPSKYLLRSEQKKDLEKKLSSFFPTEEQLKAAERELISEGIKIYIHD